MYRQAITSGFEKPEDQNWLEREGFCHLKFHGVCMSTGDPYKPRQRLPVQADDRVPLNAHDFFGGFPLEAKLAVLSQPPFSNIPPPVLLPWKIIDDSGRILEQNEFLSTVGKDWRHANLYQLFAGIWKKAKREVMQANKISFVGLSMGPFLKPAFRYPFSDRSGSAEIVVVNTENERFKSHNDQLHPRSPRGRTYDLLKDIVSKDFRFLPSAISLTEKNSLMGSSSRQRQSTSLL